VSHNMAAIQNLCDTCIYLKNGEMVQQGKTEDVIPVYLRSSSASQLVDLTSRKDRMGNGAIRFRSFTLKDRNNNIIHTAYSGGYLKIEIGFDQNTSFDLSYVRIGIGVDDEYGQRITHFGNDTTDQIFEKISPGNTNIEIEIPNLPFKRGSYTLTLFSAVNGEVADWIQEAIVLDVETGDFFNTGKIPEDSQGNFYVNHSFSLK
jgi:lipopolysaccharide transport system ATP-binding protein